jgi:hypothetical protein
VIRLNATASVSCWAGIGSTENASGTQAPTEDHLEVGDWRRQVEIEHETDEPEKQSGNRCWCVIHGEGFVLCACTRSK